MVHRETYGVVHVRCSNRHDRREYENDDFERGPDDHDPVDIDAPAAHVERSRGKVDFWVILRQPSAKVCGKLAKILTAKMRRVMMGIT